MRSKGPDLVSMVSIGKLLNQKSESVLRFVRPLLAAISRSAVESDPTEAAVFRRKVDSIADTLSEKSEPDQILQQIAAVTQLLEEYNQNINRSASGYRTELRGVFSLMADTIAALGQSNQTGVKQLRVIESSLSGAATLTEVQALRNKLAVCLTLVRNEGVRAQHESDKLLTSLKTAVLRASAQINPHLDRATALPGVAAAVQMMGQFIEQGKGFRVIVFLLDGLQALNARFGRTAGDEALLVVAQHLGNQFDEAGTLTRWNGPAFLLISEQPHDLAEGLERKVKECSRKPFEAPVSVENRIVRIPLTFSWSLHEVQPGDSIEALTRKLDGLVATHFGGATVS